MFRSWNIACTILSIKTKKKHAARDDIIISVCMIIIDDVCMKYATNFLNEKKGRRSHDLIYIFKYFKQFDQDHPSATEEIHSYVSQCPYIEYGYGIIVSAVWTVWGSLQFYRHAH